MADDTFKRILEYGNTFYALYFSPFSKPSSKVYDTIHLYVDDKLTFFGDAAVKYDIVYVDGAGNEIVVSTIYNSSGKLIGHVGSITGLTDNKKCVSCYSEYTIYEGSKYTLRVYDAREKIIATYGLIAVKATGLIGEAQDKLIIDFKVKCDETDNSGNPVIYKGATPDKSKFHPYVVYNDGTTKTIEISDTNKCYIYGLDEIDTSIAGLKYNLIVKYFYGNQVVSPSVEGTTSEFVSTSFDVTIAERDTLTYYTKFVKVPIFNTGIATWTLNVYGYKYNQNYAPELLDCEITGFNGSTSEWTKEQAVTMTITVPGSSSAQYTETCIMHTNNPAINKNTEYVFTIKDNEDSLFTYGDPGSDILIPVIDWLDNGYNNPGYYIWYGANCGETIEQQKEAFLQHFYWHINPPYDPTKQSEAESPIAFTLRSIDDNLNTILSNPVLIENFQNKLLVTGIETVADKYLGKTLIMEFLGKDSSVSGLADGGKILYGVPVYVRDYSKVQDIE